MKYIIYNIKHIKLPLVYVGSTKDLYNRIRVHYNDSIKYPDSKVYKTVKEHGGWDEFTFNILEEIDCECKYEALLIEDKYRRDIGNMNSNRCILNDDERKEAQKISRQLYYQKTKANKERYLERKDLGITTIVNSNYYQSNRDKIIARSLKRYYDNKADVLEKCKARYYKDIEHSREIHRSYYHKRKNSQDANQVADPSQVTDTSQDADTIISAK